MRQYHGFGQETGGCEVVVRTGDGEEEQLDPKFDEVRHSPDGFQWGYRGSGPSQLSFALLADTHGVNIAHDMYKQFMKDVIASFTQGDDFVLSEGEIHEWVSTHA